jgi:hypothetical protein
MKILSEMHTLRTTICDDIHAVLPGSAIPNVANLCYMAHGRVQSERCRWVRWDGRYYAQYAVHSEGDFPSCMDFKVATSMPLQLTYFQPAGIARSPRGEVVTRERGLAAKIRVHSRSLPD